MCNEHRDEVEADILLAIHEKDGWEAFEKKYFKTKPKTNTMKEQAKKEAENITEFCRNSGCEQYIKWSFGEGDCESCQLVGESYIISTPIPKKCKFRKEIKHYQEVKKHLE